MELTDPVVWGSIAVVVVSVIIVVFLAFKVKALINKDAEEHRK
jgi:hypothetical protein